MLLPSGGKVYIARRHQEESAKKPGSRFNAQENGGVLESLIRTTKKPGSIASGSTDDASGLGSLTSAP